MIKVIAVLSLLLTLATGYIYIQHLEIKAKDVEITIQLDVIKSKDKEIKEKTDRLDIITGMSNVIVTDTRISDSSFSALTNELNQIDCSPSKEVKSNATNIKASPDSNVNKYYNILRSAYDLQNKD